MVSLAARGAGGPAPQADRKHFEKIFTPVFFFFLPIFNIFDHRKTRDLTVNLTAKLTVNKLRLP